MKPLIKICCIAHEEEAELAVEAGAGAIGLVGPMPNGPGPIHPDRIREIAAYAKGRVETFLLTSSTAAKDIVSDCTYAGTTTVQIVDRPENGTYSLLREQCPGLAIVQVIHVTGEEDIEYAREIAGEADAILLDSGKPQASIRTLGGTGDTHDWSISRRIVEAVTIPVYLAGGLHPENVASAIRTVRPAGVDACSGLRLNGDLDPEKARVFVANAKTAFLEIEGNTC